MPKYNPKYNTRASRKFLKTQNFKNENELKGKSAREIDEEMDRAYNMAVINYRERKVLGFSK